MNYCSRTALQLQHREKDRCPFIFTHVVEVLFLLVEELSAGALLKRKVLFAMFLSGSVDHDRTP